MGHNPTATAEFPSNQCLETAHGGKEQRHQIIYTISYISKAEGLEDGERKPTYLAALQALEEKIAEGRRIPAGQLDSKMALSCVNRMNAMAKFPMPLIMLFIHGNPDFYSSHQVVVVVVVVGVVVWVVWVVWLVVILSL